MCVSIAITFLQSRQKLENHRMPYRCSWNLSTLKPMTGTIGSQVSVLTFQRKPGTIEGNRRA